MINKLKLHFTNPLKILGFVTIITGLVIAIATMGYLLLLSLYIIGVGCLLYLVNYLIIKLSKRHSRYKQWGLSAVYLVLVAYSYFKWQEHTSFTFPSHTKNAGIIFGIAGYPELPRTVFWTKKVIFPKNGIIITSTKAEDMPDWQQYYFSDNSSPKTDSDVVWNPNFDYNCILNNKVIRAWIFTLKKDTGLSVQRAITALSNQINKGKLKTFYKTSDQLIINAKDGTYLSLQGKGISFLPEAVSHIKVNTVYLAENHFTTIPRQLYQTPGLHDIYISANPIKELPNDLYKVKELKSLLVSKTLIKEISADLSKLNNLTYFNISGNGLTVFPEHIKAIPHLKSLSIQENNFKDLDFLDTKLLGLETLHVYSNKLRSMKGIDLLLNLRELLIFDNKLDSISSDIGKLRNLEKLEIWDNPIHYISPQIRMLTHLKELSLDDNYLTAQDKRNLKEWLPQCTITFQTR